MSSLGWNRSVLLAGALAACAGISLGQDSSQASSDPLTREQIAQAVEEYLATTRPAPEDKEWERVLSRLTLYGDFRLRHESNFSFPTMRDRHRERVRLRLGANYSLNDQVQVGARMVTGNSDDPNSSKSTFGDGLDSVDLSLDRVFATWRPAGFRGLTLRGGKFQHGFTSNPVYGELVWDNDVQPEGIMASYRIDEAGPFSSVTVHAGDYLLLEQAGGSDASVFVAQVEGAVALNESWNSRLALGYFDYTDVTPDGSTALLGDNQGNTTVDLNADFVPDRFESDFQILNPILSVDCSALAEPLVFSAEYMKNAGANNDRDQGWAVGAAWGQLQEPGDVRLYYQMQVIEQDAAFSPFAQDDFLFTTNHRSHLFGCNYRIVDKIGLHLWGLVSSPEDAGGAVDDDQRWRIRFDIDIKF